MKPIASRFGLVTEFFASPGFTTNCLVFFAIVGLAITYSNTGPIAFGEALSNSLTSSSVLILAAIGLAITFGVMRIINMAHGDMMMLGAYTAYVVTTSTKLAAGVNAVTSVISYTGIELDEKFIIFLVAIIGSFLVVGFVGYLLEIGLLKYLYGRPLDTLLATWGVGLIMQQTILLSFGANLVPMALPESLQGIPPMLQGTAFAIPKLRLFIVLVTMVCLFAVYWWFFRTTSGLKIRAVVQNRAMASAMGISTRRVDSMTFAFASGLAGVSGCILAHLYDTKYNMGADYVVDAFMVVTLGGLGQLAGSVGGGLVIGTGTSFIEKILAVVFEFGSASAIAKVGVLGAVVAFLLVRPAGLFTTKERSYD